MGREESGWGPGPLQGASEERETTEMEILPWEWAVWTMCQAPPPWGWTVGRLVGAPVGITGKLWEAWILLVRSVHMLAYSQSRAESMDWNSGCAGELPTTTLPCALAWAERPLWILLLPDAGEPPFLWGGLLWPNRELGNKEPRQLRPEEASEQAEAAVPDTHNRQCSRSSLGRCLWPGPHAHVQIQVEHPQQWLLFEHQYQGWGWGEYTRRGDRTSLDLTIGLFLQ